MCGCVVSGTDMHWRWNHSAGQSHRRAAAVAPSPSRRHRRAVRNGQVDFGAAAAAIVKQFRDAVTSRYGVHSIHRLKVSYGDT